MYTINPKVSNKMIQRLTADQPKWNHRKYSMNKRKKEMRKRAKNELANDKFKYNYINSHIICKLLK